MIITMGKEQIMLIGQGCIINGINWLIVKGHKPAIPVSVTVELIFEASFQDL